MIVNNNQDTKRSYTMNAILHAFLHSCVIHLCTLAEEGLTPSTMIPMTATTAGDQGRDDKKEEEEAAERGEIGSVPTTEEVMDLGIKITNVPDVEEEDWDPNWDKSKAVRDIAYYLRAHKFRDYDRRYYRRPEDSGAGLYEEFPKPPLRSLHWEVRRYCEASFRECLKYLHGVVSEVPLKREDDTVTIMRDQKWSFENNAEQIRAVQRDCRAALRRDSLTVIPFQGPIERFQWRTTASYYMCWYTMLDVPELSSFGEPCDNHADCEAESADGNRDPRADDGRPYACALYSFCPDHCCPMKHLRDISECHQSDQNPCYAGNQAAYRECTLDRQQNRDFLSLLANRINVSCECREPGYEWSSMHGLCVDVNECGRGEHGCSMEEGEMCMNLPGGYECVCRFGYTYDAEQRECIVSVDVEEMLQRAREKPKETEGSSFLRKMVQTIARSSGDSLRVDGLFLLAAILSHLQLSA